MRTLTYSAAAWSALRVEFAATDGDLAAKVQLVLMDDRGAYPAATLPAPIADRIDDAFSRLDRRQRALERAA